MTLEGKMKPARVVIIGIIVFLLICLVNGDDPIPYEKRVFKT